jgi:hypothetical protein
MNTNIPREKNEALDASDSPAFQWYSPSSVAKEHYKYAINLANTHLKQETINLGQVYGVHIMTWFVIQPRTRESDCEFS